MKKFSWKNLLPHAIAIGVFLIIAIIYCRPAVFEGKGLGASDNLQWKAMAQESFDYKAKHGHMPMWNTHLFSGMPNYQISFEGKSYLIDFNSILSLGLPAPASYFFIACLCFYILGLAFRFNPFVAAFGALSYAYATYNPLIVITGHETKMIALMYAPGVLAGLKLLFDKKYWVGFFVLILFAMFQPAHPQVAYYLAIIAGLMTLVYIVRWVKAKEYKHLFIAITLSIVGGLAALGNNAITLLTTAEYTKYTMRGGKTIDVNDKGVIQQANTKGLDFDYAMLWSIWKAETLELYMPNAFGGGGEHYDENSKAFSALVDKGVPEQNAAQIVQQFPKYWGGKGGTSGPEYIGALVCFLAIIALVVYKGRDKWWIIAATILAFLMAWGGFFSGFNSILFNHLPMYNKFRAPSMALVIPEILLPLMACLGLQEIFFSKNGMAELKQSSKKVLYAVGGLLLLGLLIYLFIDFRSAIDEQILQNSKGDEMGRVVVNALIADRKSMFLASWGRALLIAIVALAVLFLYLRNILKPVVAIVILGVITLIDLFSIDTKYLNSDMYQDKEEIQASAFTPSPAYQEVLKDKEPHYRVLDVNHFDDAFPSYYFRSVGGYNPAKLRIYQDLLEAQLRKQPMNFSVLNMLDTKYFIVPTDQQGHTAVQKNDQALGACWLVKNIQFMNGPVEELKALDKLNPKDTALVDNSFKAIVPQNVVYDSTASIVLDSYDNDAIKYKSQAASPQFAVLSEIYYPAGWNAYVDGKKTDYAKTDYALRGIAVPAGKHDIEFKFEPASVITGQKITYASNAITWLAFVGLIFGLIKRKETV